MKLQTILLIASVMAFGMAPAVNAEDNNGVRHYLSLGTSLAAGVQPDATGTNQVSDQGYPDQLFDIIEANYRKLKHTKLGCPGETTGSMINGGKCAYDEGSQLAEAVQFLHAHKGKVALVTIDMGVNDLTAAGCIDANAGFVDADCLLASFEQVAYNLATILTALRQVADPETKIVATNYYNTFLAFWLTGPQGMALAAASADLAYLFNVQVLGATYATFGIPVADVAAAFDSNNFNPSMANPAMPQNVYNICAFTYMCAPAPVGPNIHANPYGYAIMAATIASIL